MRSASLLALALALVVGAALAGCGSDGSAAGSGPVSATAVAPAATTVPVFPTGTAPADSISFRPVLVTADGSSSPSGGDLLPNPGDSDLLPTLEQLGPVAVDGNGIVRATAVVNESTGEAVVNPLLAPGSAGLDAFNAVAAACYGRGPTCPTGRIAVVLDGVVLMAPAVRAPSFGADQLQISGNWTLSQAEDVARRISAAAHG